MTEGFFIGLREEIARDYGITKKSIPFVPFEDWRTKLRTYALNFPDEYSRDLYLLKRKLGLNGLEVVNNPNKKLVLFSGIPGAGKTTLASIIEKRIPNTLLIRGHDIVEILGLFKNKEELYRKRLVQRRFSTPDPWYISYLYQDQLTRDCLGRGYNVVFDDHIRTKINRLGYHKLAKECGAKTIFVQLKTPLKTCLERRSGESNLKFLANFIFQSQDFGEEERKTYDKIIRVDGTSKISDIEKSLVAQIKKV